MVEIFHKICYDFFSDQVTYIPSYSHLKITPDHKAAWLKCFDIALNDLSINDISGKVLYQRMSGLLDEITVVPKRRSFSQNGYE